MSYCPAVYEEEKQSGVRSKTGALYLKELSATHLEIIRLNLSGVSSKEIALSMGMTDSTISRILNDPLSQEIICEVLAAYKHEYRALAGHAIDAVRSALTSSEQELRLKGVDRYAKLKDTVDYEGVTTETAEDFVKKIMNIQINGNVTIQAGEG